MIPTLPAGALRVVVPAAGKGSRSGMSLPKTLRAVDGVPILVRILDAVHGFDARPVVVVSPDGRAAIAAALRDAGRDAELVVQDRPLGMGDAVRRFDRADGAERAETLIVVWGDMVAVDGELIGHALATLVRDGLDLVFPSHIATPPYTLVVRDERGEVRRLVERREAPEGFPDAGESDTGVFVFRKEPVFRILRAEPPELRGTATGELGFLAVVGLLADRGGRVAALPVATALAASSFNSPEDLDRYQRLRQGAGVPEVPGTPGAPGAWRT
jgi:bifunctional UDP-N-acetylglucosamine pyrophosphorylase/glucosamine-1-phosphate N-acetyltransferase